MKFTNINVKKEINRIKRNVFIFALFIVIAIVFFVMGNNEVNKINNNIEDLNSIIVSKENKDDKKSYINVQSIPYRFAKYKDDLNSYYIVSDDKYMYIAYMSNINFNKLNNESIHNVPIRVEGITNMTSSDIKKLAIEAYNKAMKNEEDKLTLADFDDYFGNVYLNMEASDTSVADLPYLLSIVCFVIGVIGVIVSFLQLHKFNKSIKKMGDSLIQKLDSEMNSSNAFYYDKAHLYLTDNFIINFSGFFKVINYKDMAWVYPFLYRTNGIKTSQSIIVITKDGKKHNVANIDIITKAKKETYNEIYNTIVSKNKDVAVGFTKQSEEKAKMMINK